MARLAAYTSAPSSKLVSCQANGATSCLATGNSKMGSITVLLTSCLTGLELAV